MLHRTMEPVLRTLASQYPVVTVTGPRQSGKTTLCRMTFPDKPYVNLEAPDERRFAVEDPRGFCNTYPDGAILDEIQRTPDLVSYLQPLIDADQRPGQFILTGSQQFNLRDTLSQSLAGRTGLLTLLPFDWQEIRAYTDPAAVDHLLRTGFYPRLHHHGLPATQALGDYFETYVQRDVRQLLRIRQASSFETFVRLCAGRIGQLLNLQSLGNDAGVSHTTAREWISILEASSIVFRLPPWHANIAKRLVKTPKLYFWDVGLAAYLLGLEEENQVQRDPLRGSLFENLVVAEMFKQCFHQGRRPRMAFYRDASGNEVDLLVQKGADVAALEIKSGQTVTQDYFRGLNRFAKVAGEHLRGGAVVYGGQQRQQRSDWEVWPVAELDLLGPRALTLFAD